MSVDIDKLCFAGTIDDVTDNVFAGCAGVFSISGDEIVVDDVNDSADVPRAFSVIGLFEFKVVDGEREYRAVDCSWFKEVSWGVIGTFVDAEAGVMWESAGIDVTLVASVVVNTDVLSESITESVRVDAVTVVDVGMDTGRFVFVLSEALVLSTVSNGVVCCDRTVLDFSWLVDDCVFVSIGELVEYIEVVVLGWDFENVTVDVSCDMDWFGMAVTRDDTVPV